jgi:ribosomal protein S18 acetylase RimI-like enzyme
MVVVPLTAELVDEAHSVIINAFEDDETDNSLGFLRFSLDPGKGKVFNVLDFLIFLDGNKVIGVAGLISLLYEPKDTAWICYPAIRRELQNQGLGTILVRKLEEHAIRCGINRLFTDTAYPPEGGQARAFYSKNGFAPVGELADYPEKEEKTLYLLKELEK